MLKRPFGDYAMGRTQNVEWFPLNRHRGISVEDCEVADLPFTGHKDDNVEQVYKILQKDWRNTLWNISDVSHGTCRRILRQVLKVLRISAKLMNRLLNVEQLQQRICVWGTVLVGASILATKLWLWFLTLLTGLIWPLVVFSCFREWNHGL